MKYFKKTFLWIIILAGLAGYFYLDVETTKKKEIEKEEATRLLPFKPLDVLELELKKGDGVIVVQRWEDGWRIEKPIKAKADSKAVEKALGYITQSKNDAEYVMDENPTQERLAEFGLIKPQLEVTLRVGKELTPYTLIFGERAPTKGVAFAILKGSPKVYRVLADARAEADQSLYYFRDKTIFKTEPNMVDKVEILKDNKKIKCELPMEGKWNIISPIKGRADMIKIIEIVSKFKDSEIKEFIDEEPKDLKAYGLYPVKTKLSIWLSGDESPTETVFIGDRDKKKRGYFAKLEKKDNVFLIEENMVDLLPVDAEELRERSILFFEEEKVNKIEVKYPDREIVVAKTPEFEWKTLKPRESEFDFNIVKEFLKNIREFKIKEFVSEGHEGLKTYGLDKPAIKLLIWEEGNKIPHELNIGSISGKGDGIYVWTGEQDSVVLIDEKIKGVINENFKSQISGHPR
ncbi:MAG: DUF4340 domain-containing protein [Nitrospinae bacterium]|nr:DUF4340 domain-containing protein [Nitrospinota bacterium]